MAKYLMFGILICLLTEANAQISYPLIIEGQSFSATMDSRIFNFTNTIISPEISTAPVVASNDAEVKFISGSEIILKPGFTATSFNSGSFVAQIQPSINVIFLQNNYTNLSANIIHIPKWEEFELAFNLPPQYEQAISDFFNHYYDGIPNNQNSSTELNPYADDSLSVQINLTSPSGQTYTKWAFYMRQTTWASQDTDIFVTDSKSLREDYLNPLDPFHWHLRFAPDEANTSFPWTFTIAISSNLTNFPAASFTGYSFMCDDPLIDNHGHLEVNANNHRYLQFEDLTPFFAIGHNIPGQNHDYMDYTSPNKIPFTHYFKFDQTNILNAISETHDNGGNFLRLWFTPRSYQIEFYNLGVFDYYEHQIDWCRGGAWVEKGNSQLSLGAFDEIVQKCRQENIYFSLAPDQIAPGGAFENWWWGDQAYLNQYCNYLHGAVSGFDVSKYFCDPANLNINDPATALYYWRRKYKYLISRYGYSVNFAVLESFNEIDLTLGYKEIDLTNDVTNTSCPQHKHLWPADPNTKLAIEKWHDVIFRFIKQPTSQGGLGQDNLLTTVSYSDYATWNPVTNFNLLAYYSLYDDNNTSFSSPSFIHCDITDIHNYNGWWDHGDAGKTCADWRFNIASGSIGSPQNNLTSVFSKPFHFGEGGMFGSIQTGLYQGNPTSEESYPHYNNYEISFHNEIWSTMMQGSFGISQTWFTNLMHRWVGSVPEIPNTYYKSQSFGTYHPKYEGDDFYFTYYNSLNYYFHGKIKKLVKEYNRPKEFIDLIDFNQNYNYYSFVDNFQNTEWYGMSTVDRLNGYGWIHNLNAFWYNQFYYSDGTNMVNYIPFANNCIAPSASFGALIPGYLPFLQYDVDFFYTKDGSIPNNFPTSISTFATMDGEVYIQDIMQYLGCEPENSDIAFIINLHSSSMRAMNAVQNSAAYIESKPTSLNWGFNVMQNPSSDLLLIKTYNFNWDQNYSYQIVDINGAILISDKVTDEHFNISISILHSGFYLLVISNSIEYKSQKFIKL